MLSSPHAASDTGGPESRLRPPAFFPPEVTAGGRLSGEGESLADALQRNGRGLKWVFLSYGVPEHEVEDLLQDLAVLALEKLEGQEVRRVGGWLRLAAHHLAQNHMKRRYRDAKATAVLRTLEILRWEGAGWPEQFQVEMRLDLARALCGLSPEHRRLVLLRAMSFSPAQIAARTGYARKSLCKLIQRGLAKLAAHFGDLPEESGGDAEPGWATRTQQVLRAPEVHRVPGRPPVGRPLFSPTEGASPS